MGDTPTEFRLTSLERRRVRDHNPIPIVRDSKPELDLGAHVIVQWSREQRHWDKEVEKLFTVPAKPVLWITVTKVTRRRIGGWAVRYDISDIREQALFMAPKSGYTTDALQAVDKGEAVVSDKDRLRLATESKAAQAERKERSREERLKQERAHKVKLREALDALPPVAQQELLGGLARLVAAAVDQQEAA